MPSLPRLSLVLLLVGLVAFVTGCQDREGLEPEVEVEAPIDVVAPEDLVGTWVLVHQSGRAPERLYTVTFTTTGDYIVQSETHAALRQTYTLVGEDRIAIMDSLGAEAERFVYEVSGDRLNLTVPGTDAVAAFERRDDLLEERHDLRPRVPVDPHPDRLDHGQPDDGQ